MSENFAEKSREDKGRTCPYCKAPLGTKKNFCPCCGKRIPKNSGGYEPISDGTARNIRIVLGAVIIAVLALIYFFVIKK